MHIRPPCFCRHFGHGVTSALDSFRDDSPVTLNKVEAAKRGGREGGKERTLGSLKVGYLFSGPNADSVMIYYPKMPAWVLLSESRNEVPNEVFGVP